MTGLTFWRHPVLEDAPWSFTGVGLLAMSDVMLADFGVVRWVVVAAVAAGRSSKAAVAALKVAAAVVVAAAAVVAAAEASSAS